LSLVVLGLYRSRGISRLWSNSGSTLFVRSFPVCLRLGLVDNIFNRTICSLAFMTFVIDLSDYQSPLCILYSIPSSISIFATMSGYPWFYDTRTASPSINQNIYDRALDAFIAESTISDMAITASSSNVLPTTCTEMGAFLKVDGSSEMHPGKYDSFKETDDKQSS